MNVVNYKPNMFQSVARVGSKYMSVNPPNVQITTECNVSQAEGLTVQAMRWW